MIQQEINLYEEPPPYVPPVYNYTSAYTSKTYTIWEITVAIQDAVKVGLGIGAKVKNKTTQMVYEIANFEKDPANVRTYQNAPGIFRVKIHNGQATEHTTQYSLAELLGQHYEIVSKSTRIA